jgi:branched-chain amino acid transport system substrate-binding protein
MKKLAISVLGAAIVLAVLLGGCAAPASVPPPSSAPAAAPPKVLKIGVSSPLTGSAAEHGTNIQNGALMAIDDQNAEGGVTIGGQKYTLQAVVRDNKWDIMQSRSVAEELVFNEGVKAIAGTFVQDSVGTQTVTEKNKVILFPLVVVVPSMTGPDKPFTFFTGYPFIQMYDDKLAYIQKFYPNDKKILSMVIDLPDLEAFMGSIKTLAPRYGLDWQGYEKFPITITDFSPVISRVLAKNPDIIDLAQLGTLGGLGGLEIKQIRQAGFKGIIMVPGAVPEQVIAEVVPKEYQYKIVCSMLKPDTPIPGDAYKGFNERYQKKFNEFPTNALPYLEYNPVKGFFQFLNGQDSMDTTAWMQGFEKYHWQGLWGFDSYWIGKPMYNINRIILGPSFVYEYVDGKLDVKWEAPLPYALLKEQ